ncbi:unnamed protein product [Bubo scandiacus]
MTSKEASKSATIRVGHATTEAVPSAGKASGNRSGPIPGAPSPPAPPSARPRPALTVGDVPPPSCTWSPPGPRRW